MPTWFQNMDLCTSILTTKWIQNLTLGDYLKVRHETKDQYFISGTGGGQRKEKRKILSMIIGVNFVFTIYFPRNKWQSLCCMPQFSQFWKKSIYILTGFCRLFIIMVDLRYWIRRKWFVMSKWLLWTVFSLTKQSLVLGWKGNWDSCFESLLSLL